MLQISLILLELETILHNYFSPFKFIETYFMALHKLCLGKCFMFICCYWVERSVSVRSGWLIVFGPF